MFKCILIANRGEIACRVISVCKLLGIKSVAIYPIADKGALHTLVADEAIELPAQSDYLDMASIIHIAKKYGAQAIHPGYGFLSENPKFAQMCSDNGIVFIGPNHDIIAIMGHKIQGRNFAQNAGVPVLPGTEYAVSIDNAYKYANEIGYPLLVKATSGGGGMGIQSVNSQNELASALKSAVSISSHAFGDATVYLEKYLINSSHVEVQIFGDGKGKAIHIFERDCSVQRRKQKLIEETPCSKLSEEQLSPMWQAAAQLASEAMYSGAGTVEFLVNPDGEFYFIEMNTRIQVEHGITEAVTGLDLVQMQILLASGQPLQLNQEEIQREGHAIEARILAENPDTMLPAPGVVSNYSPPTGKGIRVDSGITTGSIVSTLYDPLLAKVIAFEKSRNDALKLLQRALSDLTIDGITTNIKLISNILKSEEFSSAVYNTDIVSILQEKIPNKTPVKLDDIASLAATIALTENLNYLIPLQDYASFQEDWWQQGIHRQHSSRK